VWCIVGAERLMKLGPALLGESDPEDAGVGVEVPVEVRFSAVALDKMLRDIFRETGPKV